MDKSIPEINRFVAEREVKMNRQLHKQRIREVTKQIDMGLRQGYANPINKAKKELIVEGKLFCFFMFRSG